MKILGGEELAQKSKFSNIKIISETSKFDEMSDAQRMSTSRGGVLLTELDSERNQIEQTLVDFDLNPLDGLFKFREYMKNVNNEFNELRIELLQKKGTIRRYR